jgi:hypothetical protein
LTDTTDNATRDDAGDATPIGEGGSSAALAGGQAGSEDSGSTDVQYPLTEPVPEVLTKLSPPGVLARLDRTSRRGKLPGFTGEHREGLCAVSAFGEPFDRLMIVKTEPEPDGRTRLRWTLKLDLRVPTLLLILMAITVWPGEPLTDSLLKTYFGFYNEWTQGWFKTWMWYLPLTVPAVPLTWRWAMKKCNATTHQSAHEVARKICSAVGGELVEPRIKR